MAGFLIFWLFNSKLSKIIMYFVKNKIDQVWLKPSFIFWKAQFLFNIFYYGELYQWYNTMNIIIQTISLKQRCCSKSLSLFLSNSIFVFFFNLINLNYSVNLPLIPPLFFKIKTIKKKKKNSLQFFSDTKKFKGNE